MRPTRFTVEIGSSGGQDDDRITAPLTTP